MNIKELIKNNKYICNSDNKNYMEITKVDWEDNKISICPQGGGFVKSINIDNGKFIDDVVGEFNFFTNNIINKLSIVYIYRFNKSTPLRAYGNFIVFEFCNFHIIFII